jgi:predicted ribosome quality control (RQC) complex YloA/Tae2 family protein
MLFQQFLTLSQAAAEYIAARARAEKLQAAYRDLRKRLAREIKKRESAVAAIGEERKTYEDGEKHRRLGELLLANIPTATIEKGRVKVIDYYDPDQTEIEIAIKQNETLKEAAARHFAVYQKAKRAIALLPGREAAKRNEIEQIERLIRGIESEPDAARIFAASAKIARICGERIAGPAGPTRKGSTRKPEQKPPGRRFSSSDGYEILVGRSDSENDTITFRVARAHDVWLHAADYPGSHVLIRNPSRADVPQRTIAEAAELAAFYSQAKHDAKVAVHWTQKKFVSKPSRGRPGLARLSSFKTVLVKPQRVLDVLK